LERLAKLAAPPVAIDLLVGETWEEFACASVAMLVARIEGTEVEVAALKDNAQYELWTGGGADVRVLSPAEAGALWQRQVEFADRGGGTSPDETPLALKITVPPSAVTGMLAELKKHDPACAVQAHAGNGIILVRF